MIAMGSRAKGLPDASHKQSWGMQCQKTACRRVTDVLTRNYDHQDTIERLDRSRLDGNTERKGRHFGPSDASYVAICNLTRLGNKKRCNMHRAEVIICWAVRRPLAPRKLLANVLPVG